MAISNRSTHSPARRKIVYLGLGSFAAILVYSGVWHFAATALDQRLTQAIEVRNPFETAIECEDRELGGYPFRIGVFCSSLSVDDHNNGISASFGEFRSAAQIYAPGHIVWELDGPGEIRSADGFRASMQWEVLRSSVSTGVSGLDRSSVEAEDVRVALTTDFVDTALAISSPHIETHVRRNGVDLDYAALTRGLKVASQDGGFELPSVTTSLDMTFANQATLLDFKGQKNWKPRGISAELRRFVADLGDGTLVSFRGPLSVDDDGLVSGRLQVEVENLPGWSAELKALLPAASDAIDSGTQILTLFFGGKTNGTAEFVINEGRVMLGIIPIGIIPPL